MYPIIIFTIRNRLISSTYFHTVRIQFINKNAITTHSKFSQNNSRFSKTLTELALGKHTYYYQNYYDTNIRARLHSKREHIFREKHVSAIKIFLFEVFISYQNLHIILN